MVSGQLELEGKVDDDVCIGVGVGEWVVGTVRRAPEPEGVGSMVDAGVALVDEWDGAVEEDGVGDGGWETRTRGVDVGGLVGQEQGGWIHHLVIWWPMAIIALPTSRGRPRIVTVTNCAQPPRTDVVGGVGVPTFHGRNNEYQQWTIVYNSIRQWIGMRKNRDRGKSKDSQV